MVKNLKKIFKGFTLIELIIVIGVVAILSSGAYLMLMKWMSKGRDARKIADINALSKGVLIYELENYGFPTPSNAVSLTDQYGQEFGKQGLFDKGVVDKLSSIHKTVKDPFTNEFYSYTTYDRHRGFEIGTFIESMGKISYMINNKAYADDENINPYVFVYGKVKVCEVDGVIKYPNPISVYDSNQYKYVNTKNMGMGGKVMFNMKYLNGSRKTLEGTGSICDGEVTAPIVGFQSFNTGMKLNHANTDKIIDTNEGIVKIIQEECTHNNLCNSPDIYRVRYNLYIIVYHNPLNGEITLIEAEYNTTSGNYEKKSKEKIYDGGGTSSESGKIYGIANSPNGKYQIYYGGGNGGIQVYTQGGGTGGGSGTKYTVGGVGSIYENMKLDGGASVAQGERQTVVAFSNSGTNEGYISTINEYNGIVSESTIKIPYECRMPRVIYLNDDTYLIIYIDENGNWGYGKVEYRNSSKDPIISPVGMNGSLEDIDNIKSALVWNDIIATVYNKNSQVYLKTQQYSDDTLADNYTLLLDSGTASNIQIKSGGKGDLNITYTKGTSAVSNYYKIAEDGFIELVKSSTINCESPTLSQLGSTEYVNICGGSSSVDIKLVENDKIKITENKGDGETETHRTVNIAMDSSWISDAVGATYNSGSLQIGKTKTIYPTNKFSSSFIGNTPIDFHFDDGTSQYIGGMGRPSTQYEIYTYKFNGTNFEKVHTITSLGQYSSNLSVFYINGEVFLSAANNFATIYGTVSDRTFIYKRDGNAFNKIQTLPSGTNVKHFKINSDDYIIHHKGYYSSCSQSTQKAAAAGQMECNYSYQKSSVIYKRNGSQFVQYQSFLPKYINNYFYQSDFIEINNQYYLSIGAGAREIKYTCGTSRCAYYYNGISYVYKWNGTGFVEVKSFVNSYNSNFAINFNRIGDNYSMITSLSTIKKLYNWDGNDFILDSSPTMKALPGLNSFLSQFGYLDYVEGNDYYKIIFATKLPDILIDGKRVPDTSAKYLYIFKWDGSKYNLVLNTLDSPIGGAIKMKIAGNDYLLTRNSSGYIVFYEFGEETVVNNYVLFNNTVSNSIYLYNSKKISNVIINETKPAGTDVKYIVSFDRQKTFRSKIEDQWVIVNDSEIGTKGMSSEQLIEALKGYETVDNQYIDFKIGLFSSDPSKTSSIEGIKISYEKN